MVVIKGLHVSEGDHKGCFARLTIHPYLTQVLWVAVIKVELVTPPEGATPGERLFVEGFSGEADAQLNPKKKVWEAVQIELKTDAELQACYKGVPLRGATGVCTVESLTLASIA